VVQLPDAASLDRTEKVVRQMSQIALATEGVEHAIGFPGLFRERVRQPGQRGRHVPAID